MSSQNALSTLQRMDDVVRKMSQCPTLLGREEKLHEFEQLVEEMREHLKKVESIEQTASSLAIDIIEMGSASPGMIKLFMKLGVYPPRS